VYILEQACIFRYSSELSSHLHPRVSVLHLISLTLNFMTSKISRLYHPIKQTPFQNRDLHFFSPSAYCYKYFSFLFSWKKIMLTYFLAAFFPPVLTVTSDTARVHNVIKLQCLISDKLIQQKMY